MVCLLQKSSPLHPLLPQLLEIRILHVFVYCVNSLSGKLNIFLDFFQGCQAGQEPLNPELFKDHGQLLVIPCGKAIYDYASAKFAVVDMVTDS
jgi:hypothetical protein